MSAPRTAQVQKHCFRYNSLGQCSVFGVLRWTPLEHSRPMRTRSTTRAYIRGVCGSLCIQHHPSHALSLHHDFAHYLWLCCNGEPSARGLDIHIQCATLAQWNSDSDRSIAVLQWRWSQVQGYGHLRDRGSCASDYCYHYVLTHKMCPSRSQKLQAMPLSKLMSLMLRTMIWLATLSG